MVVVSAGSRSMVRVVLSCSLRCLSSSASLVPDIAITTSPHPDCPLKLLDRHYVIKEGRPVLPAAGVSYINSRLKWRNFHSTEVELAYCSDFDLCQRETADTSSNLAYIYLEPRKGSASPFRLNTEAIAAAAHHYEHDWKLTPRLRAALPEQAVRFCRLVTRGACGFHWHLSPELNILSHLQYVFVLVMDDVAEDLHLLPSPLPFTCWRSNLDRVLHGNEAVVRHIPLDQVPGMPASMVETADLAVDILADVTARFRSLTGPGVLDFWIRIVDHFLDGTEQEPALLAAGNAGRYSDYTRQEFMRVRGRASGLFMVHACSYSDWQARRFDLNEPLAAIAENMVIAESDLTSYFKENRNSLDAGRFTAANQIDWLMQVRGLTFADAVRDLVLHRNNMMRALIQLLPFLPPEERSRFQHLCDYVTAISDYGIGGGISERNSRYGWYLVPKQEHEL